MKWIQNPFYVYSVAFALSFIVYHFSWSLFYPELSLELNVFISSTIAISFALGKVLDKLGVIQSRNNTGDIYNIYEKISKNKISNIFYFIWFILLMEVIANKGLPLFDAIGQTGGNTYAEFGIPFIHVLFVTFKDFFTLFILDVYMRKKDKYYIKIYLFMLLIDVFILNRGDFLWLLISSFVIYIYHRKIYFGFLDKLKVYLTVIGILFFFGVIGNYRSVVAFGSDYSNDFIIKVGQASPAFKASIIPGEFFWAYLYISSPLANLQHTITVFYINTYDDTISLHDIVSTIGYAGLPDFISKRLMTYMGYNLPENPLMIDSLNVSTMYNNAYMLSGFEGMIIEFIFLMLFSTVIVFFFKNNCMRPLALGMLVVICSFSTFSDILTFSGWTAQIFWMFIISKNKTIFKMLFIR